MLLAHSEAGSSQNRKMVGRANLADHQLSTVLSINACIRPILSRRLGRLAFGVAVFGGSLLNGWSSERQQEFLAPDPVRVFGPAHVADPAALHLPAMPLEIDIDTAAVESDHPGVRAWAVVTAELCRKWYPVVCATLGAEAPPHRISLKIVPKLDPGKGAHAEETTITVSVESILRNPSDYGSMIHELTHIVQGYTYGWFRNRGIGWLVEGIADYVRFYVYEVDPTLGGIRPGASRYSDGYRSTACFLDYIVRTYDRNFVKKLHRTLRAGNMSNAVFNQMLLEDPEVPTARHKGADVLFEEFIADWSSAHAQREGLSGKS
jgi:Peptidase of plants and bacteria